MSKNSALLSLLMDPEPPESGQRNAGCGQEEVKELLQLLAVPGTDLQPELLFCGSSFHGNVAPCLGSESDTGGSSPEQSLGSQLSLPGDRNWSKSRNSSGKRSVLTKVQRTLSCWKCPLCLFLQINNMKTKFKETIEKCDSLEQRLNDLLKEKQSVERKWVPLPGLVPCSH